jgi:hypothetical protein
MVGSVLMNLKGDGRRERSSRKKEEGERVGRKMDDGRGRANYT